MAVLSDEMKALVRRQRLGYIATISPDGAPNLSPKGTITVWDEDHLVFADIRSPRTVRNLMRDPRCELNVVDPFLRKGYRFRGTAEVIAEGELFDRVVQFFRRQGVSSPIRSVVLYR